MRARETAGTAEALERYRRQAVRWVRGGGVAVAAAVALGLVLALGFEDVPVDSPVSDAVPALTVLGLGAVMFGLATLRLARRMRRVLAAGDWSAHPVAALPRGVLVLAGPEPGVRLARQVVGVKDRYAKAEPGHDGVLWWCGDPRGGGVIAPPGGGELFWTRPVRGAGARRRAISRAERRGLADRAAAGIPQPAAAAPALSHGPLAEAARRQAAGAGRRVLPWRRHRPEPDVRTVAWWRVRGLREIAGVDSVGLCLLAVAALFALGWLFPEEGSGAWLIGALAMAGCCLGVFRLVTSGRPAARLLARTAAAPVAVRKRYVSLTDPYGGAPVLVVFPAHGGPEDRPEGLLPLLRFRAPGEPVGEVDLHGLPERDADGRRVVVARSGGRVLWPTGPYLEAGTPEFAAVAQALAGTIPHDGPARAQAVPGQAAQEQAVPRPPAQEQALPGQADQDSARDSL
ncbi:hypothetical protein ACH4M4_12350 [Streptomyces sp. NPDC017254]|uniref:hypothetical protein n=1 Tax=unclassified Streptomyces TaxID=2593676 RepID=UPI0037AFE097